MDAVAILERMPTAAESRVQMPPERWKPEPEPQLRRALTRLHVQPFTPESVARYKRLTARRANWTAVKHHVVLLAVVLGLTGVIYAAITFVLSQFAELVWWPPVLALSAIATIAIFVCFHLMGEASIMIKRRARWETLFLHQMPHSQLPKKVRRNIKALRAICPQADFFVHRLTQGTRVLDPFLEARLGAESYFVMVWNEEGFVA